jgi:hypothetical protein
MYSISNIYLCKLHAACTGNLRRCKKCFTIGKKNFTIQLIKAYFQAQRSCSNLQRVPLIIVSQRYYCMCILTNLRLISSTVFRIVSFLFKKNLCL